MVLDASLFAHIQNDAFLSGTYKLEGNFFSNTVVYLNQYINILKTNGDDVTPEYLKLADNLAFLVKADECLSKCTTEEELQTLVTQILNDILKLQSGEKILLPGGWLVVDIGHAMVYQIEREADTYFFTVFNAGSGLQYHAKKSTEEKELIHPAKAWSVPVSDTEKGKMELGYFIERLLQARLPASFDKKKHITAKVLYEEILPSISYINGEEVDVTKKLPEHSYTAGLLSGTCSQRSLHQMLKVNSKSINEYQRFIFKFKQYVLVEYMHLCLSDSQPFNEAVAAQIDLAIENNLKILSIPGLFTQDEFKQHFHSLNGMKKDLKKSSFNVQQMQPLVQDAVASLSIVDSPLLFPEIDVAGAIHRNSLVIISAYDSSNVLTKLSDLVKAIQDLQDSDIRYYHLQQLILTLPVGQLNINQHDILKSADDYELFLQNCNAIQHMLLSLRENWIGGAQLPTFDHLSLFVLSLQMDAHAAIAAKENRPLFWGFTSMIMVSVLCGNPRDPFKASNNPVIDRIFLNLRARYLMQRHLSESDLRGYFKELLKTEPELNNALKKMYVEKFDVQTGPVYKAIKKHGLESLYMISLHLKNEHALEPQFLPIINKIKVQLAFEAEIRRAINPFFAHQLSANDYFELAIINGHLNILTCLYTLFILSQKLATTISKHKYNLKDPLARAALEADLLEHSLYKVPVQAMTSNAIQLKSLNATKAHGEPYRVTQEDIWARDYYHLRTNPFLQIAMTLDYFTRHISRLGDESTQRYVEANLFQPESLFSTINRKDFFKQLDDFLVVGKCYFAQNGQHTRESLFFFRLDFLVSNYKYKMGFSEGLPRLKNLQHELIKQLDLQQTDEVVYVFHHYLFLTRIAQLGVKEQPQESFEPLLNAYLYLMKHTNPAILEDTAHRVEMELAVARFKILASHQTDDFIKKTIMSIFQESNQPCASTITGLFPIYTLSLISADVFVINILLGKVFQNNFALSGVPLVIQNHPLIKQLDLHEIQTCQMSPDGCYMLLQHNSEPIHLYYKNQVLLVQRGWVIGGEHKWFELQALTRNHLALQPNTNMQPITADLPAFLTDNAMNFWTNVLESDCGILTYNNVPAYYLDNGTIWSLDVAGNLTDYRLAPLEANLSAQLNIFESNRFLLSRRNANDGLVELIRYELKFQYNHNTQKLTHLQTGEAVVNAPSPIHPTVAGLVLKDKNHARYLVPVARFYAASHAALVSDFYPVLHDTNGIIAQDCLNEHWKRKPPLKVPLWSYTYSEHYVSFQLNDGVAIADTSADALYLAYIYLATNQTKKAWQTLDECMRRLGGLKGDVNELRFISWICKDVPFLLPSLKNKYEEQSPLRRTPPYIACQLKAMSILADYLAQDHLFDLQEPDISAGTANSHYALLCYQDIKQFLNSFAQTIYLSFNRLQTMTRHLEHGYCLSKAERKCLLDFYYRAQPKGFAPLGALGYQWMCLSLEALQEEQAALLAHQASGQVLSKADNKRVKHIERQLKNLEPVKAISTQLKRVAIDLKIPRDFKVNHAFLKQASIDLLEFVDDKLMSFSANTAMLQRAVDMLSSKMSDDDFISNFLAYIQIASSGDVKLAKSLVDFCSQTLLAKRHVALIKQDSNIPFLCMLLYRIAHNKEVFKTGKIGTFATLVSLVSAYAVPNLEVYQAEDIYSELLAKPEDLIAKYARQVHTPISATIAINQLGTGEFLALLSEADRARCAKTIEQYKTLQKEHFEHNEVLRKTLLESPEKEFEVEKKAGQMLLALEKQKKEYVRVLFSKPLFALVLLMQAQKLRAQFLMQMNAQWDKALDFANLGPDEPERALVWAAEKTSQARAPLTRAHLLSLYLRADKAYSIEQTGLSAEKTQKLHDLIHVALVCGIKYQTMNQVANNFNEVDGKNDLNSAVKALDLLSRPEIPALNIPAIVLLQHEEHILLLDRQVSALKELLAPAKEGHGFNEVVEKIIMGGGKSKVILPILAEQKARGDNLVIIEVPEALLATNHEDLNRVSQRLFGKRAHRFEFHRDSNCAPERLEQIYNQFISIITDKGYLVTTGPSMQSLELKYVDLLYSTGPRDESWEKQVYWCDKLINLIRHHGDCIIDEVHQGLSIKKKLIYTLGNPVAINMDLIENAIALYKLISLQFIKDAPQFDKDYDWTKFQNYLAAKLIVCSPLHQFVVNAVKKYGQPIQQELIDYLTDTAKAIHPVVLNATKAEKESLAFFKQELSILLPQTLGRRLDEHYGASKRSELNAVERTLALPYAANNIVNERNRFGNPLEAINYTVQMMLIQGVSKELLVQRIEQWHAVARQELFQNPGLNGLDDTPTAKAFAYLVNSSSLTLSQVQLDDEQQMNVLHIHLRHNQTLIFELLREQVLKQIQLDDSIIHSDSLNHVDMYRSVQALSGTPSNNTTYHQRLKFNISSSMGTDGYISEVIEDKNTQISSVVYSNVYQFIETILSKSKRREHLRTFIDSRPVFQGVSNDYVAQVIALYYRSLTPATIKHILYFDEQQVLCALDIQKPDLPIVLKTTDEKELSRLLGSSPNERFTYYDQVHTEGTDIKQDEHAHSAVFVDEKTSFYSSIQSCMRMRGLSQEQSMEFFVPESMKKMTRAELFAHFKLIDESSLSQDNLIAARLQMTNFLRRNGLDLIQELPSDDYLGKTSLAKAFQSFFITISKVNLFELYGGLNKPRFTSEILDTHRKQLLSRWSQCVKEADIDVSVTIEHKLQEIINKAIGNCLKEYTVSDDSFANEVEVQTQLQKSVQINVLNECYSSDLIEKKTKRFPVNVAELYAQDILMNEHAMPLNALCNAPLFSKELLASRNYAEVYEGQQGFVGAFLKPVFFIWYHLLDGVLQAMIVTSEDVVEIVNSIASQKLVESWIATTQDTFIAGCIPHGINEKASYHNLREQVRFFNGEFASLLNQKTPLQWLREHSAKKLHYFETALMSYRPGSASEFQQLQSVLLQVSVEGFDYIEQHSYEDLSQFDWKKLVPNLVPAQAAEYKRLAETFAYINQKWSTEDLDHEDLRQQFSFPLSSIGYVVRHLTAVLTIKKIIKHLREEKDIPFLALLSPDEHGVVESYLGKSLNGFLKDYGLKLPFIAEGLVKERSDAWKQADTKALLLLRAHPALMNNPLTDQDYFVKPLVRKITVKEDLFNILKLTFNRNPPLHLIIRHPLADKSVAMAILDLPCHLDDLTWSQILAKNSVLGDTGVLINRVLQREDVPHHIIDLLLIDDNLTEAQLLKIIDFIQTEPLFYTVFAHPLANKKVRDKLFAHRLFSAEKFLYYFLTKGITPIEELSLVLDCPGIGSAELKKHIGLVKSTDRLMVIIAHAKATPEVLSEALVSPVFSLAVVYLFMEKVGDDTLLLVNLLSVLIRHYKSVDSMVSLSWEDAIVSVCGRMRTYGQMHELSTFISTKQLGNKLNFIILNELHEDIAPSLPLQEMAATANEDQKQLLVDCNITGSVSEAVLMSFLPLCTTEALINILLDRYDLTQEAHRYMLLHLDLSEDNLFRMLRCSLSDDSRKSIYLHKNASKGVRFLLRNWLTADCLLAFLTSGKSVEPDELMQILKHPAAITARVSSSISERPALDERVLVSIVAHPQVNESLLYFIMYSPCFSPTLAKEIFIRHRDRVKVVESLLHRLFHKYHLMGAAHQASAWEDCLIQTLEGLDKKSVLALIDLTPINSRIGFALLHRFGTDILPSLPFNLMVLNATGAEFQMLIDLDAPYTADNLLYLASHAVDPVQRDFLLARVESAGHSSQSSSSIISAGPIGFFDTSSRKTDAAEQAGEEEMAPSHVRKP
ncbi:MAG: DUF3638 domain-containing protein [Legionella sp.]|nr:DUF3638 domain-containing protein [Legionella sp.]